MRKYLISDGGPYDFEGHNGWIDSTGFELLYSTLWVILGIIGTICILQATGN